VVGEAFESTITIHQEGKNSIRTVTAEVLNTCGHKLNEQRFDVPTSKRTNHIGELRFTVPATDDELFMVRLKWESERKGMQGNLYIFSTRVLTLYEPALKLEDAVLKVQELSDWKLDEDGSLQHNELLRKFYKVSNTG